MPKFHAEQIALALHIAKTGTPVAEDSQKFEIVESMHYV